MKLYFDLCALKRPFDDRSQLRVDREAAAVLGLLETVEDRRHRMVWSIGLTFENNADPDVEVRSVVASLEVLAGEQPGLTREVEQRIMQLVASGLSALDSAHLAFAEAALCDALLTCDDQFLRRANGIRTSVRVLNPLQLVEELAHG